MTLRSQQYIKFRKAGGSHAEYVLYHQPSVAVANRLEKLWAVLEVKHKVPGPSRSNTRTN